MTEERITETTDRHGRVVERTIVRTQRRRRGGLLIAIILILGLVAALMLYEADRENRAVNTVAPAETVSDIQGPAGTNSATQ